MGGQSDAGSVADISEGREKIKRRRSGVKSSSDACLKEERVNAGGNAEESKEGGGRRGEIRVGEDLKMVGWDSV